MKRILKWIGVVLGGLVGLVGLAVVAAAVMFFCIKKRLNKVYDVQAEVVVIPTDADLGVIIAYMKSLPPVDKEWDERQFTPLAHILIAVGVFGDALAAEVINHTGPRPVAPAADVTAAYGEYLAVTFGCHDCHGEGLAGGYSTDPAAS